MFCHWNVWPCLRTLPCPATKRWCPVSRRQRSMRESANGSGTTMSTATASPFSPRSWSRRSATLTVINQQHDSLLTAPPPLEDTQPQWIARGGRVATLALRVPSAIQRAACCPSTRCARTEPGRFGCRGPRVHLLSARRVDACSARTPARAVRIHVCGAHRGRAPLLCGKERRSGPLLRRPADQPPPLTPRLFCRQSRPVRGKTGRRAPRRRASSAP